MDRSNNAIVWLDPNSCNVLRQLTVTSGFDGNPHDLLSISSSKAYVTLYTANPSGAGGNGVVIINPQTPALTGNIIVSTLATQNDNGMATLARPDRAVLVNGHSFFDPRKHRCQSRVLRARPSPAHRPAFRPDSRTPRFARRSRLLRHGNRWAMCLPLDVMAIPATRLKRCTARYSSTTSAHALAPVLTPNHFSRAARATKHLFQWLGSPPMATFISYPRAPTMRCTRTPPSCFPWMAAVSWEACSCPKAISMLPMRPLWLLR